MVCSFSARFHFLAIKPGDGDSCADSKSEREKNESPPPQMEERLSMMMDDELLFVLENFEFSPSAATDVSDSLLLKTFISC